MSELDRPARHDTAAGASSVRRRTRPTTGAGLAWSCLVMGAPLGAGLTVNATVGWWPGLAAFLIAALLIGAAAYRRD